MPVILGAKPEHGFDEPLGLLSDCHRRIEAFLGAMLRVIERTGGGPLAPDERQALDVALKYFATAAPRHTEDEEGSLFPRLRASEDPAVRAAIARIDALEGDHRRAEVLHEEVDRICRGWLDRSHLAPREADHLAALLSELRNSYVRHIAVEDAEIFPLAGRTLSGTDLQQIGQEMAHRRGLKAPAPNPPDRRI